MQLTFAGFWFPLFVTLLLSHIAAQGVAILLRPLVLRQSSPKRVAAAVRQAKTEVEETIWGNEEPRLRRQAGYMSGVRSSRRRREEG